jgi:transglutaminase-like putative cysteine protease
VKPNFTRFIQPKQNSKTEKNMSSFEQEAFEKYKEISKQITDPKTLSTLRKLFERTYTLQELLDWLHPKLQWSRGEITRYSNPLEILKYRKGRCGEYSILYTALCLAHGYRARIILDMTDHVWTEVWNPAQKRWMHIDPSEKKINDPKMYERDWRKKLAKIYAFENGKAEDVAKNYKFKRKL